MRALLSALSWRYDHGTPAPPLRLALNQTRTTVKVAALNAARLGAAALLVEVTVGAARRARSRPGRP
jgi:hypothetical protein